MITYLPTVCRHR